METKGLFGLDINDSIWNDVGLGDIDNGAPPPDWLADNRMQSGIRAMLELDHCKEEEK
jgi:hypothetical protein